MLAWLGTEHAVTFDDLAVTAAAHGGYLDVIKYLVAQGCAVTTYCVQDAACFDHLYVLQWLYSQGLLPLSQELSTAAAENFRNGLKVLKWLIQEVHCPWDLMEASKAAARSSNIEMLQYLHAQQQPAQEQLTELLYQAGFWQGGLNAVKWLRERGAAFPPVLGDKHNNAEKVRAWTRKGIAWARSEGCSSPAVAPDAKTAA